MKRGLIKFLTAFLFLIGVAMMAYPFVGNWYNGRHQGEVIENYEEVVNEMEEVTMEQEFEKAQAYNEGLLGQVVLSDPFQAEPESESSSTYNSILNTNDEGMMGYVQIPKINVKLPIYHSTSPEALKKGVGHLEKSSLPIGGSASHAVLSAHTGYPTAEFFTNLTKVQDGDSFYLVILNKTLAYKVDQIKVVEPTDISALQIDRSQDYVTLVTCTPYGVNSHRLLVRGVRTDYEEAVKEETKEKDEVKDLSYLKAGLFCLFLIVVCAGFFWILHKRKRNNE